MKNIIDIYDVGTYPEKLIDYFEDIKKYIDINNIKLSYDSIECINEILEDYYLKCVHVTRTNDINTYYENGILRPFVVIDNSEEKYIISLECKNALLNPLKEYISKNQYDKLVKKYDEILKKEYKENNHYGIENWYGKYSNVCYVIENMKKIKEKTIYKEMYQSYGGEIIKAFTDNKLLSNKILNIGKPYAIFFRIPINEIYYIEEVYHLMISLYINKSSDIEIEKSINKDILATDIIEIKEIE